MKRLYIILTLFIVTIFSFLSFSHGIRAQESQEIDVEAKKIEYTLPYHGILPDHPLYFFKKTRDSMWVFFTRDNVKKAELLLLLSDKKVAMSNSLAEKGKWGLGGETLLIAEKDFEKLIGVLTISKKQGVSPQEDFVLRVKLSNEKHGEVIEDILIGAPQGDKSNIEEAMKLNKKLKKQLDGL